jgi:hypothetical protein
MRWNLRMSSLPASRATPTPNATTPSAVATMCFIVRAFPYLPGRAFPAQILSVRSESRPLMFISPGWLPASVGYRVEGRPGHGLRSRFWRFAPTRLLNLGRASESCLYAPGAPIAASPRPIRCGQRSRSPKHRCTQSCRADQRPSGSGRSTLRMSGSACLDVTRLAPAACLSGIWPFPQGKREGRDNRGC